MQDETNRRNGRQRTAVSSSRENAVGDVIRQAFLTHMGEQQRQFAVTPVAARRPSERDSVRHARQQQHTGGHDKAAKEAVGADQRGGTRAGAENVGPRKKG
jgi:hypothetical protein